MRLRSCVIYLIALASFVAAGMVALPARGAEAVFSLLVLRSNPIPMTPALEGIKGFREAVLTGPYSLKMDVEHLNLPHSDNAPYLGSLQNYLNQKYANRNFDLVVLQGDGALNFWLQYAKPRFTFSHALFFEVYQEVDLSGRPKLHGIRSHVPARENLSLIGEVFPRTKGVLVLFDSTFRGRHFKGEVEKVTPDFWNEREFVFLDVSRLTRNQLQAALEKQEDAAVLALSMEEAGAEAGFDGLHFLENLTQNSSLPVFTMQRAYLDAGAVAGVFHDVEELGREAGKLALQILANPNMTREQTLPRSTLYRVAHYGRMKALGLTSGNFPKKTRFIHHPSPVLYSYRSLLSVLLTAILCLLILFYVKAQKRKRRLQEMLNKVEEQNVFNAQLLALQEVNNELSIMEEFDQLCRRAVELARARLGFERVSLWFLDENPEYYKGSFGTDEEGNLRDERGIRFTSDVDAVLTSLLRGDRERYFRSDDAVLLDPHMNAVGKGTLVRVAMWDGKRIIGNVHVDNLLQGDPITDLDCEILVLFATSLAYLCTRVREEEQKARLSQQLLHTQKLESMGVLAGGIAHDFNNILMGIIGNANLLQAALGGDSPQFGMLRRIEDSARRAAELSGQMLAYSGKGKFLEQTINLEKLIREMNSLLEATISKKARLEVHCEPHFPLIEGDETQLRQLVLDLVTNASEALGDKEGSIGISLSRLHAEAGFFENVQSQEKMPPGVYGCLEISDNGCGMDEETQRRIFDPFFTTRFFGRGLGLPAVMGIVRGHHGAIKVTSRPGLGSIFRIYFPGSPNPEPPAALPRKESGVGRGFRVEKGLVLVVDDEKEVRQVTGEMLAEMGFRSIFAEDGQSGVDTFKAQADEIQLILLDMTMPLKDGSEVLQEVREIKPDQSVIVMSGYTMQEIAGRFNASKMEAFLQKPFSMKALREKMQEVLNKDA